MRRLPQGKRYVLLSLAPQPNLQLTRLAATDVEGIFRLSGSEKRIKELKIAFDSPDRYGKGLDWTGYTVHDAANILRRYFNQLPEPIIPLDFYERFREPLRNHQAEAVGPMDMQSPSSGPFDATEAIRIYQLLITELPPLNRQLLLYILDLLAVFASKSDMNKMTTANLSAIFQPGILSHPDHDMAPAEYRLSQDILIFLIENQDHFLIGMHGTAADEKTVRDVQSASQSPRLPGTPTTPGRSRTVVGRSASNASAGADSNRKYGGLRRNVSVSSKTSKLSTGPQGPSTPTTIASITVTNTLGRSNTVPSKRSGASPRYPMRERGSRTPSASPNATPTPSLFPTPTHTPTPQDTSVPGAKALDVSTPVAVVFPPTPGQMPIPAPPEVISASSSESNTPQPTAVTTPQPHVVSFSQVSQQAASTNSATTAKSLTPRERQIAAKTSQPSLVPASAIMSDAEYAASPTRAFLDIFKPSPTSSDEGRKDGRRKLQKKRIPGSALSSAQSSEHSLRHGVDDTDEQRLISPITPTLARISGDSEATADNTFERSAYATAQTSPRLQTPQRTQTDSTLRPIRTLSPSQSYRSHTDHEMTDTSDADYATDATHGSSGTPATATIQKKRRWRISQSASRSREPPADRSMQSPSRGAVNNLAVAEQNTSTADGSGGASTGPSRSRLSFQEPASGRPRTVGATANEQQPSEGLISDSEEQRRQKGPMSWIRGKIAERKERQRSPHKTDLSNASRQSLALEGAGGRGKSMDVQRQRSQASAVSEAAAAAEKGVEGKEDEGHKTTL